MAVAIATLAGLPIGLVAGYLGGAADDALMRVIDALQAFPALILAMAISAALGPGLVNVMIAVGIVYTPRFARLVRGQVLSLREELFVEGARAAGASHLRILARHVLPNVVAPVTVQVSIGVAFALLAETVAVLPRRRHQAARAELGHGRRPRLPLHAAGALARLHPGHR